MLTRLVGRILLVLCLLLPFWVAPAAARAASRNTYSRYRYTYAGADFSGTDASGCVIAQGGLSATVEENLSDGKPVTAYTMDVYFYQEDVCTGSRWSAYESRSLTPDELRIDQNLNRAELNTSLRLTDAATGVAYPAEIQLAWTGVGPLARMVEKSRYEYIYNYSGTYQYLSREAKLAGAVRLAGQELLPATGYLNADQMGWTIHEHIAGDAQDRSISTPISPFVSAQLAAPDGISHLVVHSGYAYAQTDQDRASSGCVRSYAWVHADEEQDAQAAQPKRYLYLSVNVYQYDTCLGQPLLNAVAYWVPVSGEALAFSNHYRQASLDTSVQVEDYIGGAVFPVEIHLAWEASGPMYINYLYNYFMESGRNYANHMRNPYWDARLSGTVTGLGIDFLGPGPEGGLGRTDQTIWQRQATQP